ncbi:hypothetical protein BD413DRAFT_607140 [Trametes elegans]|nr:hypothetical protein BD413DRAFT_607140 [Trametes elegans]
MDVDEIFVAVVAVLCEAGCGTGRAQSESGDSGTGYEPHELIWSSALNLIHPDEFSQVKELHYTTFSQDQAVVLAYLRMRHNDPYNGYVLCGINLLVGSVSFAAPGPKVMHNAITPTAKDLDFRRWNDLNPIPPCPLPPSRGGCPEPRRGHGRSISFDPLPEKSVRTALILDRFSVNCGILYCSNDSILSTTTCMGRSFFDFVARKDKDLVCFWIDIIKCWGMNERGQPSDGGFGFGKFTVLVHGRDSSIRHPNPVPSRHRNGSHAHSHADPHAHSHPNSHSHSHSVSRTRETCSHQHATSAGYSEREKDRDRDRAIMRPPRSRGAEDLVVDAIFSAHSDGHMVILCNSSS